MKSPDQQPPITWQEAYRKATAYCAYQERTRREVEEKLRSLHVLEADIEPLLAQLEVDKFIDELRFARVFAGSKFRLKKWGKIKIRQEMKARGVADALIRQGLNEIDPDAYEQTLHELLEKKNHQERASEPLQRKQKLLRFAMSKGYEQDIIWDVLNALDAANRR